ncbi:MAG: S8 family serine peptidase, partial [Alphaproteobacteria bacterium]|nr:S8 family serine peptidase [Alphaproteobacteria bacterium]
MKNFPLMRLQTRAQFLAFCAAALLAGCGGGGGGSTPTATSQTSPTPTQTDDAQPRSDVPLSYPRELPHDNRRSFTAWEIQQHAKLAQNFLESPEFKNSWHLEHINAHKAYARGATGRGEIVGVIDYSLHLESHVLDGGSKVVAAFPLTTHGTKDPRFLTQRFDTHGTQVASVAVGARGNSIPEDARNTYKDHYQVQGVAYDAKLAFADASYGGVTESNAKLFNDHGAAIVNLSFGVGGSIDDYSEKEIREKWGHLAPLLAQAGTNDADKTIFVWAAGNRNDGSSVGADVGVGVYFPELRGHVLAVTGVAKSGRHIYQKCGRAKAFCLAAPADDILTGSMRVKDPRKAKQVKRKGFNARFTSEQVESSVDEFGGTSAAAPIVSGALALMRQFFSEDDKDGNRTYQLGNTELVARLLATANNRGIYSDSDKYGHGLLDLDAATTPYGMLLTSLQSDPNAQPFDASAFSLSGNA